MAKIRKRTNKNVPAKGRLRDMADRLWSLAVRSDWCNQCAVCGNSKCEAHHLIPRQHERTRYDLNNGIALCASHHQFDPEISPHQNAAGWLLWLAEHCEFTAEWYTKTVDSGDYKRFEGTKNAQHYIDVIQGLREYVEDDEFVRIVGVRLSGYLAEERMANG